MRTVQCDWPGAFETRPISHPSSRARLLPAGKGTLQLLRSSKCCGPHYKITIAMPTLSTSTAHVDSTSTESFLTVSTYPPITYRVSITYCPMGFLASFCTTSDHGAFSENLHEYEHICIYLELISTSTAFILHHIHPLGLLVAVEQRLPLFILLHCGTAS